MTPRTFHNILRGRKYETDRRNAEWKQQMIMHRELVVTILSPHIKKADRDRAYKELYELTAPPPKKKQKANPVDFWQKIDGKEI